MIKEKLGLDDKDIKIISYYMENPMISQSEIAEKLKLSQPSVFVRIQKLKKKGLLDYKIGINFNKTKLFLCRVDLTARSPNSLLEDMKKCPFFVNGFVIAGENNVSLMFVHEDLKKIDQIINTHLRVLNSVTNIKINVIVSSLKDYIFQMDLTAENEEGVQCNVEGGCEHCKLINLEHQ